MASTGYAPEIKSAMGTGTKGRLNTRPPRKGPPKPPQMHAPPPQQDVPPQQTPPMQAGPAPMQSGGGNPHLAAAAGIAHAILAHGKGGY